MGLFDSLFGRKGKVEQEVDKPVRKASAKVNLLWSYQAGDWVSSVAIGDGYVAAGSRDKKVYLFDYSGKLLWNYEIGS
ncbi:PQQ-binding-like beta-propeller repeat protein, partial [Dehalococcoidia bacterium]|nr:PQQ-binding-like beta-propeller repeat protein [Dehalococcoidia bacterium]